MGDKLFSIQDIEKAFDKWAEKYCVAEDTWPEAWHDFAVHLIPLGVERALEPTPPAGTENPIWNTFACRSCAKLLDCIRDNVRPDADFPCYTAIKGYPIEPPASTEPEKIPNE